VKRALREFVLAAFGCMLLFSCAGKGTDPAAAYRTFPKVKVPSVCGTPEEGEQYALEHYWDAFFSKTGMTDSTAVAGVKKGEVEEAVSSYVAALEQIPLPEAQKYVSDLFSDVETYRRSHPEDSLAFLRFTEIVARYLYDPNSPMRNEDLFLPFVRGLAASEFTGEDRRPGYEYQARMCSLNQFGQQVPDFSFKDASGRIHTLYGVRAEYTMLFFSNPGCNACKDIIDQVCSRQYVNRAISDKFLAVVNIYIDQEIDKWLEYEHNYPRNWITGYDHLYRIREEQNYDIRAIPSLYLLDVEKRVIMKDAPTERVMSFLDNKYNQYYGNNH